MADQEMAQVFFREEILWIVIVGFLVAFVLAFGIGANDVANSFGTSVGSKVLTLGQACALATIFEIAGAVLIGYKVSDTMRKGILDVAMYEGDEKRLAAGCLAALLAGAVWLMGATALGLPVSGTHSVVGATVGFSLAAKGTAGINWGTLGAIVLSWFVSPALSGAVSAALYWLVRRLVLRARRPLRAGLLALPFFYGATVLVNVLSIALDGPKLLHMDNIPKWVAALASCLLGVLVAILVQLFVVPHWKRKLEASSDVANVKNVNFTFGASNDTTPQHTPIHMRSPNKQPRPTSWISDDARTPLEAITETSEMVVLKEANDTFEQYKETVSPFQAQSPPVRPNGVLEMNARNMALLATMEDCSILSRSLSPPHYLRKDILNPANPSLNNGDLTITSLKYIDETLSCSKSIDSNQLCGIGNSYESGHSYLKNSSDTIQRMEGVKHLKNLFHSGSDTSKFSSTENEPIIETVTSNTNCFMKAVDSGSSIDITVINPALTPNSSAVPLILGNKKFEGKGDDSEIDPKTANEVENDSEGIMRLFSFLQILTASFGSFAHGGNDVSNAIGPLIALWLIYKEGGAHQKAETPLYILAYGGAGIAVGLWVWGRKVIRTVGTDLTSITPDTGFTIEIGAALTVLLASKAGLPISTTHCKVGSVVCVGALGHSSAVDWRLFRHIIYAWIITVPIVAGISSFTMFMLDTFVI